MCSEQRKKEKNKKKKKRKKKNETLRVDMEQKKILPFSGRKFVQPVIVNNL